MSAALFKRISRVVVVCAVTFVASAINIFADWPRPSGPPPASPRPFTLVTSNFANAQDIGFDGQGYIYSRKAEAMIRIHSRDISAPAVTMFGGDGLWGHPEKFLRWNLDSNPAIGGIRIRADGDIIYANPITRPGRGMGIQAKERSNPLTKPVNLVGFRGPTGVHTDRNGNIWFAGRAFPNVNQNSPKPSLNFIDASNKHVVLAEGEPLDKPWGVTYDEYRGYVYFVETEQKKLKRIKHDLKTFGDIEEVASVTTPIKGVAMDQYGRVYLIGETIYRIELDDHARMVGSPEPLNDRPIPRASSGQFGHGEGWDRKALYIVSNAEATGWGHGMPHNQPQFVSHLWKLDVGVEGDPAAQMDPAKFKPIDKAHYDKWMAKAIPHFEEQWSDVNTTIKKKLEFKAARDGISPQMDLLKKIGATAARDPFNAEGLVVLSTGKLTGSEPELTALKDVPGMTSLKIENNPNLTNFTAFFGLPWCGRFFMNNLPHLDDEAFKDLAAANSRLNFAQIEHTAVTVDAVVDVFKSKPGPDLFVSDYGDDEINKLIAGGVKPHILWINNAGSKKKLSFEAVLSATKSFKSAHLKVVGASFSEEELRALKAASPRTSFEISSK